MTEPPPGGHGLVALARRLGAVAWVAEQLFAIEGRWAASMTDPAAVVHLGTFSRHHGWHAQLWRDALPDSPALAAGETIQPPSAGWATAIGLAGELDDGPDPARLAYLYRGLVPRAASLLAGLDDALSGPGDAQLVRTLGLVLPDVLTDAQRGHRLLETTLSDRQAVTTAISVTETLDQAFLS